MNDPVLAGVFLRLVVRTLAVEEATLTQRQAMCGPLVTGMGFSSEDASQLVEETLEAKHPSRFVDQELRALAARFGEPVAQELRDGVANEMDLATFGSEYGAKHALRLLDTMFAVSAAAASAPNTSEGLRPTTRRRLGHAAHELRIDEVLVSALVQKYDVRFSSGALSFPISGDRVLIGRATACPVSLPDPQVAIRHAELVLQDGVWRIIDLGSGRPTVVNGVPVTSAPLDVHSTIQVGPFSLQIHPDENRVSAIGARSFSTLSVRHLTRTIGDTSLLDDVSFSVFSGEVVAVVGPSGAGKTTLLNAINGITPADSGSVLLDGHDFHRQLALDRTLVGIVSQDDLVNPELTVSESLRYSAQLRLSSDTSSETIAQEVERVSRELDIQDIADSRVGDTLRRGISGGQRKRVNLGQELISQSTRILFLDEPTSGLDPRASQDIIRLVRQLADAGRLVFLVTHDLTPEVIAQVDHLLVLTAGGRLSFFGPPAEANRWFEVPTPDAIFNRLAERPAKTWGDEYREGDIAQKYVQAREELLTLDGVDRANSDEHTKVRHSTWRQTQTLTARYTRVKMRDRMGMLVLALQPPILALIMVVVFPAPTAPFLFMLALTALWFGMSASVRELISAATIFRRERMVGVKLLPYLASEVLLLGTLIAAQCIALVVLPFYAVGLQDYGFDLLTLTGVCVLTGWVGMSMGLLVSSSWNSSEAAVGTLPLLLIPQITFSSIMVSVRDMGVLAKALTWATVQRYTFDAVIKCGDELAVPSYTGDWQHQPINGSLWQLGLKFTDAADDRGFDLPHLVAIMAGFIILFSIGTLIQINRKSQIR